MIDHLSLGVAELGRSRRFYDAALGALGYRRLSGDQSALAYGVDEAMLWLLKSTRPVQADAESGLHVAFQAQTRDAVDAFHDAALRHGGQDNGAPGFRPHYGGSYYAAFVLDPDGYRIEAHCEAMP